VATYGDQSILRADLEKAAAKSDITAKQALYQGRKDAIDQLINDGLLQKEAAGRSISVEELLKAEVEVKVAPPSDAAIEAFYNANRAQMPAPLDQMRPRLAEHLLVEQQRSTYMSFIEGLRNTAKIQIFLEPYRIAAKAGPGARKGAATAPIEIIEYSDFECGYCGKAAETVQQVLNHYGDKVSVVYRHYPLGFHKDAHLAAQASECANEQGQFWAYHDKLFANQRALGIDSLIGYGNELNIDGAAFEDCLRTGKYSSRIDQDMADGDLIGMEGTPGFYINGINLSGAQPFEAFQAVIDEELARANN